MSAYDIRPVPRERRDLGFLDVFSIWFGAGISIAEFWAGALLTPAVGLGKAVAAIMIGHGIGNLLLAIIALAGYYTGLPTMVLLRKTFGKRGSIIASMLNFIQLLGWTAIMLVVGAEAAASVSERLYHHSMYHLWILIEGVMVTLWALVGPRLWRPLERVSMILLFALTLYLGYIVVMTPHRSPLQVSGELGFWVATDLVIAMPVSWAPLAADYSRFSRRSSDSFWGTFTGYFASSGLFYLIGAYTNLYYGMQDPIALIAVVGLGIPAFLIIVLSTVTTTFMDVYSAGISLKNVIETLNAKMVVLAAGLSGIVLAVFFPMEKYMGFLLLIGGMFVPLSAILSVDYLYEKRAYHGGRRSMPSTVNIVLWTAGFVLYVLFSYNTLFGRSLPLFTHASSFFGASIPTLVIVMVFYVVARRFFIQSNT